MTKNNKEFSLNETLAVLKAFIVNPLHLKTFSPFFQDKGFVNNTSQVSMIVNKFIITLFQYHKNNPNYSKLEYEVIKTFFSNIPQTDDNIEISNKLIDKLLNDAEVDKLSKSDYLLHSYFEFLKSKIFLSWFEDDFKVSFSSKGIASVEDNLKKITNKLSKLKYKKEDSSEEYDIDRLEELFKQNDDDNNPVVKFGIPAFDSRLKNGGFSRGTLVCFIAKSGGGKTQMTSYLILQCILQKKRVHVISVEEQKEEFFNRIISALTDILKDKLSLGYDLLSEIEKRKFQEAKQLIKKYTKIRFMYDSSVDEIYNQIEDDINESKLNQEDVYMMSIVDYTQHISGSISEDAKFYEKMIEAYKYRKRLALKHNLISIDYSQVNKEGSAKSQKTGKDATVITREDISQSYGIVSLFDVLISLNQTEKQMQDKQMILYIDKTRASCLQGTKWLVKTNFAYGKYDFSSATCINNNTII